jgi:hypothetical protein
MYQRISAPEAEVTNTDASTLGQRQRVGDNSAPGDNKRGYSGADQVRSTLTDPSAFSLNALSYAPSNTRPTNEADDRGIVSSLQSFTTPQ